MPTNDYFAHKAASYEQDKNRVDNVAQIAEAIKGKVRLAKSMHLMDFGSGTGLLLERIAPSVGKITAVDVSQSMNEQLRDKLHRLLRDQACEVEIFEKDLEQSTLERKFDGIISSMTMHHIKDIEAMFRKFHAMLGGSGFIAIADLDREDGTFHGEETGVHHLGFDQSEIAKIASAAGFKGVETSIVSVVRKPQADYPVFLLTGFR